MKLHVQAEQHNERHHHVTDNPRHEVVTQTLVGLDGFSQFLTSPARACAQQEQYAYSRCKDDEDFAQGVVAAKTAEDRGNGVWYVDEFRCFLQVPRANVLMYRCLRITEARLVNGRVYDDERGYGDDTQGQQAVRRAAALALTGQCERAEKEDRRDAGANRRLG